MRIPQSIMEEFQKKNTFFSYRRAFRYSAD